jgi:anti-sigma B factor antagonist
VEARIETIENITIARIEADYLDAGNAKEFKRDIMPMLEGKSCVILDMSRLKFIDSSGIGAIVSCLRQLNSSGGDLKLSGMLKSVRELSKLMNLHRLFDIYADKNEAIAAFQV